MGIILPKWTVRVIIVVCDLCYFVVASKIKQRNSRSFADCKLIKKLYCNIGNHIDIGHSITLKESNQITAV
jgi:hypothetical protein